MQIHLQNVGVDNLYIVKNGERFRKDREKARVNFHADDTVGAARKLGGQHADARADLQHADAWPCAALLGHARADGWIDQKILPKSLGKCKSMPPEHIADLGDIGQVVHRVGPLST